VTAAIPMMDAVDHFSDTILHLHVRTADVYAGWVV
jgi:hypothetical protein